MEQRVSACRQYYFLQEHQRQSVEALSHLLKGVGMDKLTGGGRKAARGEAPLQPHMAARLVQEILSFSRDSPALENARAGANGKCCA
jgi:hypothetical protein